MKLNLHHFRGLTSSDWRVLTAVEIGTKNHEIVPTPLIIQLASLRNGASGVHRCIATLAKANLISRERNMKYDGYRLTYGGYDYLALYAHRKAGRVVHVGSQMGVGKESDIYLITSPAALTGATVGPTKTSLTPASDPTPSPASTPVSADLAQTILKIHRLGRTSFRTIKNNRSYHGNRAGVSWQYLSRLSAAKEFAAMSALHEAGFPTPTPVGWNRHTVVMTLVPGMPLRMVPLDVFGEVDASASEDMQVEQRRKRDGKIAALFGRCAELAMRLAEVGLIHGDLNEFNILIENVPDPSEPPAPNQPEMLPHLIDFPQITSMGHPNAETYFDRDIQGIKSFFRKRYHFELEGAGPAFKEAVDRLKKAEKEAAARGRPSVSGRLDGKIEAMGFKSKSRQARELEEYYVQSAQQLEGDGPSNETDHGSDAGSEMSEQGVGRPEAEQIKPAVNSELDYTDKVEPAADFTPLDLSDEPHPNDDVGDLQDTVGELSFDQSSVGGWNGNKSSINERKRSAKAAAGWSI